MPDPILVLEALGVALATAAGVLLLFGWPRRKPDLPRAAVGAVVGMGLGFYLGCLVLGLGPRWSLSEGQDRLLVLLIPAVVVVELAGAFPKVPRWLVWLLRLIVAAAAAPVLLNDSVYLKVTPGAEHLYWPPALSWLILGGLGAGLAAVWAALEVLGRRAPGGSAPAALAMTAGAAGLTVMLSGSLTEGQLGLPLAAALLGIAGATLLLPRQSRMTGPLGIGTVALFGLLVNGQLFASLSAWHALLLFVAPLVGWLPEAPILRRIRPWLRGWGRVGLVGGLAGIVVFLALRQHQADSHPPSKERDPAIPETTNQDYFDFKP